MLKLSLNKYTCHTCPVNQLCIAKDVTETELHCLDSIIKKGKRVAKKKHIYQIDHPANYLYAIYKGSCKEYWIDENGNECITNFYFPGDIIGIESLSKPNYMFYTAALENMELCVIPIPTFLELMENSPSVLKRFITITSQKMQHDQNNGKSITANEKVADFLLNIASRLSERNPEKKQFDLTMSQIDIANFLGITPETINRVLSMLKRKKIIKLKNKKFEIINSLELQKLGKLNYEQEKIDLYQ